MFSYFLNHYYRFALKHSIFTIMYGSIYKVVKKYIFFYLTDTKILSSPPTSREIVCLNVGGYLYTTTMSTLTRYPSVALGNSLQNCDREGNVFIDRDGKMFEYILGFLRTKKLCLPSNFCDFESLTTEVNYYNIPSLSSCLTKAKQEKLTVQFIEVLETKLYEKDRTILKGKAKYLKTILHLGKFDCPTNLEKLSEEESEVLLEKRARIQLAEILSRNEWTLISSDFSFSPSFSEARDACTTYDGPHCLSTHRRVVLLQCYRDRWKK